ncbi:thymidine phosphorylase [Aliidongia dinghuensis]|uniref:Thymidine phosphorylase n=1 Tax=Aliidongia dinghuensis TaxID=1867774 RepID=A0A8J2YV06_9PROT|nr:thymidine phosphorylase [Aliidongia dinghuensis]GGF21722.1 thymidine phosphorylase [Aliidongia dinghuensis]
MIAKELLARKRDGAALAADEIAFLVGGITDGSLTEGQVAAFAMAVCCRGMERAERVALTDAMTRSGRVLDWRDLGKPVVDKHSTGGVGDKTSLMLAPILAAAGAAVPMISGRGLGHTGGTLDKLDAIPGYQTRPPLDRIRAAMAETGAAMVGQTDDLAPADKRLYAIRDTTGTVESIPLITASILSKKLAAGLQGLVLDVKYGSGAFMARPEQARALAQCLVEVGDGAGLAVTALLTDMNEVLGDSAGNALEVLEAVEYLTGVRREPRLDAVTRGLAVEMLRRAGLAGDEAEGAACVEQLLASGAAAETFGRMVASLGGPSDFMAKARAHLPAAPVVRPVLPAWPGVLAALDARRVGLAVLALGGGRNAPADPIDYAVGFSRCAHIGDAVGPDRPLALVHARTEAAAQVAIAALQAAAVIGDRAPAARPLILDRLES